MLGRTCLTPAFGGHSIWSSPHSWEGAAEGERPPFFRAQGQRVWAKPTSHRSKASLEDKISLILVLLCLF